MHQDRIVVCLLVAVCLSGCQSSGGTPTPKPINTCFDVDKIQKATLPVDFDGPTLTPEAPSVTVRAGYVDQDDGQTIALTVPEGAQSVALMVEGTGNDIVVASSVVSPSGGLVWDFMKDVLVNKTSPDDDPYTLLLPSNPAVTLEPGTWFLRFLTDDPKGAEVKVEAHFKTAPTEGLLDLNLFFVGLDGLDAATAKADPKFQTILKNVEAIFQTAGVSFGTIDYINVEGDDAKRFRITSAFDGELGELFKLSEGRSGPALNFFFVADLEGESSGFSLLGIAGGVPGPPGVHGTGKSGVAVNMTDFLTAPSSIEIVMAHEAGHYLGLYHTTERNGTRLDADGITGFDPMCDTLLCNDVSDANGNKILSAKECAERDGRNLMFSLATKKSRTLTEAQGQILRSNVLVR